MIKKKIQLLGRRYSGIYIRTFGCFYDFTENPIEKGKNFGVNSIINRVEEFYSIITLKKYF